MQNDVFNPVADTVNKQSELLLKEQNCFTVIDESIPSPREIQSEDTIVLPEIVSMTDYIRRHYEKEIICACIVQPRLSNTSTYEMTVDDLVRWAETDVRPKALLAYEGKGEFCAGEWCRFCKGRYTCRKRSEYHMSLAERDFRQPDLLSDEEIADILPVAESLNSWVQDLLAYATQEALGGKNWPGYKLVAGRTVRKYTSEAEVIQWSSLDSVLSGKWSVIKYMRIHNTGRSL